MSSKPFSFLLRNGIYYVRFKNELTGNYISAKSTRTGDKKEAERIAWKWLLDKKSERLKIENKKLNELVRSADLSDNLIDYVICEAKKRGIVKSVVKQGEKGNINAFLYCLDFWDFEKSPYIRQKIRMGQKLTKKHCEAQKTNIKKHFEQFLKNKLLGEIIRADIEKLFDEIGLLKLSGHSKNYIMRSLLVPLKFAYFHEIIPTDLFTGWIFFSEKYKKRQILSPEQMQALFAVEWGNPKAKLAAILSSVTGLRLGEILGLQKGDLDKGRIYLKHSWSEKDGLKTTKNGEEREIIVPFMWIIDALLNLAEQNPYKPTMDAFVFWGSSENKPLDHKIFNKFFKRALINCGFSEEESRQYCFHSLRHFFTTNMYGKINDTTLQRQTGHKTHSMLLHYADHETETENSRLCALQRNTFFYLQNANYF